ncbi:hypothetical protein FQA47_003975, partial [Oryzias melastigma]
MVEGVLWGVGSLFSEPSCIAPPPGAGSPPEKMVPLSVYQSSSHECLKRTSETSLDANRIHVCETSPEAFPPVMRFADAPNETSPQRKAFVCKSDGGRPCRHHRDPPMQPLRPPPWRGKHGNEITEEGWTSELQHERLQEFLTPDPKQHRVT